jgi:MinD-like ATPase involved in chromosome partitioning or flagellar assembly
MPLTGPPEIAHDERHAPPLRHAPPPRHTVPEPAPSQRPAALAPGEIGQPGWPPSRPAQAQPERGPAQDAAPAAAATPASTTAPHVPAATVPPTPADAIPHPPGAAPGAAPAAAHAPAEAAAQAPAEPVPHPPAVPHVPAEPVPHAPAEAVSHAPAEAAAPAPAEPVPQARPAVVPPTPAGAAAQAAPFTTAEASLAPPEAPPVAPAEPAAPAGPAEPAAPPADAAPPSPPIVVVRGGSGTRPAAVERALGAPGQHRGGTSWREHVRVVPGGHGPGRPDMERRDRARVLLPIRGPRLIVVLGCTVGAGQTVTALMLADVLASLRTEPVAALDLNPGQTSLAELAGTSPAATARGLLAGQQAPGSQNNGPRNPGQLDLIAHDVVADGRPDLTDAEYARLIRILGSRYPLTLTDPGATAVARVLPAADQLVLVAPASADAAQAVTMTMEWLDGHGYGDLVTDAIAVINGVSKRSMTHVEQAELVVRGRCRATVRVPWDDHLGASRDEQLAAAPGGPGTGEASRFGQLRPPVQHAYTALAGVLVSALAVEPARPHGAAT